MGAPSHLRSVGVLGAGTMGAQIAALFANAGVPALLLDVSAGLAHEGLMRARGLKPDPFYSPEAAGLITTGGFDTDLERLGSADWIIEAVVERVDVKRGLLERVDGIRRPGTIVTSNTSGILISTLAEGRSDDFRRHLLGTHFFNPPRYLHLVEVIPTSETDPAAVQCVSQFLDRRFGKGVVAAKDTPNFIANHIGLYGVLLVLRALESGNYTIEEIDAMTGPALGRPKSATFRTMDIAGIDVLAHAARNLSERLPDQEARTAFELPPLVRALVDRGWIGEKAGQGFYKRLRSATGVSEILALDPVTLTYRPQQTPCLPDLEAVRNILDVTERSRALFCSRDKVGEFMRRTLGPTLLYTARIAPDIAHSIDDVDRTMKWGFGWELGPFEIWDAIGVREVVDSVGAGLIPPLVHEALQSGRNRFRDKGVPPASTDLQILKSAKDRNLVVGRNAGASLVDLGDGVLAVEFHSKMNAIGEDAIQMLHAGVKEAAQNYEALIVGNEASNFSAGANLMLLLLEAQEENWDEIDRMVRAFQGATQALRYADVPVVIAINGLTLGGGCEIALHGDRIQAAAESYLGLVETGVGLIPAGGGTKEMLARCVGELTPGADLLPAAQRAFETIGFAKVSTSATDARALGYLRDVDRITMNGERVIADGKAVAIDRVREGYRRPRSHRHSGRRRQCARRAEARRAPGVAQRADQRPRRVSGPGARFHSGWRLAPPADRGERTVSARSRARSVFEALRRAKNAGAYSVHTEDGEDTSELTPG